MNSGVSGRQCVRGGGWDLSHSENGEGTSEGAGVRGVEDRMGL